MSERSSPEQQKLGGIIILVMIAVGAVITIAKSLFPTFLLGSITLGMFLIISIIIELVFRNRDCLGLWDYISTYIGLGFFIFLFGLFVTHFIGYGIGGTSLGQASVEVYNAFTVVDETMNQAIYQSVEENCKVLPVEGCTLLRNAAKTARSIQDIEDIANTLKNTAKVADVITSN